MQIHPARKKILGVQESIGMPGVESLTVSGIAHCEWNFSPGVILLTCSGLSRRDWSYAPRVVLLTSNGINFHV